MWEKTISRGHTPERLAARRRKSRRRAFLATAVLLLIIIASMLWDLRQNALRINSVTVVAGDSLLAAYATAAMQGSYLFGIIPRDSTVFVPEHAIRSRILADHPDIAAVSIYHTGIRSIALKADTRTAVARWCGLAPTEGVVPYCYLFDPNGFVYEALPDPESLGSSTPPTTLNTFALYAPLAGNASEPLHSTIAVASSLPATFDFARRLSALGSPVTSVVIHDGEVDDALASGSVVKYVLGQEEDAFTALNSAKADFNLADGSVDYIDARFPGKLYVKPKE